MPLWKTQSWLLHDQEKETATDQLPDVRTLRAEIVTREDDVQFSERALGVITDDDSQMSLREKFLALFE